ncbi:MAG: hypothetical protein HYS23_04235 [Geobacter sp.]|nr:hypothetical protein [Geobacter sp.]
MLSILEMRDNIAEFYRQSAAFCISALLLLLCGCSATSTFKPYPGKIRPLLLDLQVGRPIDLTQRLLYECQGNDSILYLMERGRVAQITGQYDVSLGAFRAGMEAITAKDNRAVVSASKIGAQAAAVAINDNAIPYEGDGYERVFLHHYQAINYLEKKDLSSAGVEIRRANAEQEESLRRHEADLELVQKETEDRGAEGRFADASSQIYQHYAQLDEVAGKVKNSFQNAYTFYLSGIVYELNGEPNDAYIDYKKALEIFPENRYLQQDVLRLAGRLHMDDELAELRRRFDAYGSTSAAPPKDAGELIVLFEDGLVPHKEEVKIPLPVPGGGFFAVAFPIYNVGWSSPARLTISDYESMLGETEPICDVRALAVRALKEKVPAMTLRQILRGGAKAATTAKMKNDLGPLGELTSTIWNIVSENADLRSWLTLPDNAQIFRAPVSSGPHRLVLTYEGVAAPVLVDVDVRKKGKTILRVVRIGNRFYNSSVTF